MRAQFREDKATQAAARLLRHAGGRMEYLKLIKLLYLAERESLVTLGSPLTYDACWSLPYGPILSATLDRVNQRQLTATATGIATSRRITTTSGCVTSKCRTTSSPRPRRS